MIEYVNLHDITPADYNPREISDEQFKVLQNSIRDLGYIIPILVNRKNNVIIAGHQRTKAGLSIGIEEAPAFFVEDIQAGDEIKFNQFHNGTDLKQKYYPEVYEKLEVGFHKIDHDKIEVVKSDQAQYIKEMCKLIESYGNVFCAVICRQKVILHTNYVIACQLLNVKVNVSVIPDDLYDKAINYFSQDYGKYTYKNIKKNTYVQGLAQLHRLSSDKSKKQQRSHLYENVVMPFIKTNDVESVLDFGCGKGAYVKLLSEYMDAVGLEFFHNNGRAINMSAGNRDIDRLIKHLKTKGLFDMVVCDSVLNSVDCMEAEDAVVSCLVLFSKKYIAFSGRTYEYVMSNANAKHSKFNENKLYFMDDEKFSANYRKGQWFYQHFHSESDVKKICEKYGLKILHKMTKPNEGAWRVLCEKTRELTPEEATKAIDYEFNLPLPNGRYNRHEEMKQVLKDLGLM